MNVLIAEDDNTSRHMLDRLLRKWGYDPVPTIDGEEALAILQHPDAPLLAILDWMMPGLDGVTVARRLRDEQTPAPIPTYIIMLTAKAEKDDIVQAFDAGADDYLTKPFHAGELRARLMVGERIVGLQRDLNLRINALEDAVADVHRLQGILSICSYCKNIRDDKSEWQNVDGFISEHTDLVFSHCICDSCYERIVVPELARFHHQELYEEMPAPEAPESGPTAGDEPPQLA